MTRAWIVKIASWSDVLSGRARYLDANGEPTITSRAEAYGFATELQANRAANRWENASVMPKAVDVRGFPRWPERACTPRTGTRRRA